MLSPRELRIIRECVATFLAEVEQSQHWRWEQLLDAGSAASVRLETLIHNTLMVANEED